MEKEREVSVSTEGEQKFVKIESGALGDIISDLAEVKSLLFITERFVDEEMTGSYPLYDLWNVLKLANQNLQGSISKLCALDAGEHSSQVEEG